MNTRFDMPANTDIAWCPGCGNFSILSCVKESLEEENIFAQNLVFVSGIGQSAKLPQYMNVNYFNGLHGRSLPVAVGIKASNPSLTVIVESGEGDMYGEGGNHFIHAIRRNLDIVNIVHNNMIYGLTKGQASPTTMKGMVTSLQTEGVILEPFNPIAVAISLGATFVARSFSGDRELTKEIIKAALEHKGYAFIDIFFPCISFNKVNDFKWYKDNTYKLDQAHDKTNRIAALEKAFQTDRYPLGIFYQDKTPLKTFDENLPAYEKNVDPLWKRSVNMAKVEELIK